MAAAKKNLLIEQGATFRRRLTYRDKAKRPINLTGCSALLQVRSSAASEAVLLELSTANGGITLLPTQGVLDLVVDYQTTAALTFLAGVYDLILIATDGTRTRLLEGAIKVSPRVTREA